MKEKEKPKIPNPNQKQKQVGGKTRGNNGPPSQRVTLRGGQPRSHCEGKIHRKPLSSQRMSTLLDT